MRNLPEIKEILSKHKSMLTERYPIKSIAIFGSYARNEQLPESDIDILVEFSGKIGIAFIDLAEELESLTGTKIDLVSKHGIQDKYLKAISSDLIYV
jgi:predicted nucleotidyltransferase